MNDNRKNKRMIRFVATFAAILAFAGVFWYVWSPFNEIARLERALFENDHFIIRELVDFDNIRENKVESIMAEEYASATVQISWDRRRQELAAQVEAVENPAAMVEYMREIARESVVKHFRKRAAKEASKVSALVDGLTPEERRDILTKLAKAKEELIAERGKALQAMERNNYSGLKMIARDGGSKCCNPLVVRGHNLYYKSPNVFVVSDGYFMYVFKRRGLFSWRMIERKKKILNTPQY